MKSIITIIATAILLLSGCSHYFDDVSNSEIVLPTIKELPALIYPKTAQQKNYTGKTSVYVFVSKEGTVLETDVYKSSGYDVLDSAALDYCKKITFNPATVNKTPVNSRTIFTIKFDLSDQQSFARAYVAEIDKLLEELSEAAESEKFQIQKEILFTHKEFLGNVPAGSNPNSTLMKVIADDLAEEWRPYRKSCPLTFLVYYDFLKRFPTYNDISSVKNELTKAVNNDLKTLEKTPVGDFDNPAERDKLSLLIRNYIKTNYPDLNINHIMNRAINS
jgi:TonB family protein